MSFTRNLNNYLKENNHYHRLETTKNLCYNDNDSNNNISEWSNHIEDYQFLQQIGSGSFGQVFKSCLETNECAIKRICKSKSPQTSFHGQDSNIFIEVFDLKHGCIKTSHEIPNYFSLSLLNREETIKSLRQPLAGAEVSHEKMF